MVKVRVVQPLSERHKNFGGKAKYDDEFRMALLLSVRMEQLRGGAKTDHKALKNIKARLHPEMRQGLIAADVQNRLAPLLSKARKRIGELSMTANVEEIAAAKVSTEKTGK